MAGPRRLPSGGASLYRFAMKGAFEMRSREIKIRCSDDELETIRALAAAHGTNAAAYLRSLGVAEPLKPVQQIPAINRELYGRLGSAAGNLQRMWTLLSGSHLIPAQQLAEVIKALKADLSETRRQLLEGASHD